MSLDRDVRQVLAELELISHGATVRFDPSTAHGDAGSRVPTGEHNPPHIRFRARFDGCKTDRDRLLALEAAQAELKSLKTRTVPIAGVDGAELLRRQVLEDHVGISAVEVSIRLYCTTTKVRKIRMSEGLEPDTGLELFDLSETEVARARRYAAQGVSERDIARFLCKSQSTVRRLLERAA